MNQTCIIITATINPSGPFVAQTDPKTRLAEYEEALAFYTELPYDIYFVENSGFDFEQSPYFAELQKSDRVTFWSIGASGHSGRGKGYQEFEMLDQAVDKLNAAYRSFVKISGRYVVRNAKQLIAEGVRGIRIDRHRKNKVAITGFFHSTLDFYKIYLRNLYLLVDDPNGLYIEHVLYRQLAALQHRKWVELFRQNPDYHGVSGSHGNTMRRNPLKMRLRNVERRLLLLTGHQEFFVEY